jgi:phosphate transport system permease protein
MSEAVSAPGLPRIPAYANRLRSIKDTIARHLIGFGGGCVIIAIALIFCYLLYEVFPLFMPAKMEAAQNHQWSEPLDAAVTLEHVQAGMDELGEVLFYRDSFGYRFVRTEDGRQLAAGHFPENSVIVPNSVTFSQDFGVLTEQKLSIYRTKYDVIYPQGGGRYVKPSLVESELVSLSLPVKPSEQVRVSSYRQTEDRFVWVAVLESGQFLVQRWDMAESLFDDSFSLEPQSLTRLVGSVSKIDKLLIGPDLRWLYAVHSGNSVDIYDLTKDQQAPSHRYELESDKQITNATFLLGSVSVLLGDDKGDITQITAVRDEQNNYEFKKLRRFDLSNHPIVFIEPEQRRKGFAALDAQGNLFLANSTAERVVLSEAIAPAGETLLPTFGPRANLLAAVSDSGVRFFDIHNEHPEVSWKSLWQKVWYEGYEGPQYLWQSSAADNDFEPKLSLMPLTFGTLKAAFYAMLLAMPLAICGAIYTAYFMATGLRRKVKPAIELMEALPTVILGFLAGLWLAPLVEKNLPGIFTMLFLTPILFLVVAFAISKLPSFIRQFVAPPGWEPMVLVPTVLISVAFSMALNDPIQQSLFGGDVRVWLDTNGISFDQRNALVVGFAMGFAVIPTIFSIAEDAVFAVPKSLTQGSLALGASPWQTLVRVVLPTASPGIFSGTMIGFGRAVGETMIVLMATGNTPIMDFNIFEGFRTLSANIAVELPEAEVHSTHFRILFLAALVLFIFTFVLNTSAEYVRQRLRDKYGSL